MFRAARPYRKAMKLVEQLFGFGMLMLLLRTQEYIVLAPTVSDNHASRQLVRVLNPAIHHGLEVAAIIVALKFLWDLWQFIADSRHPTAITHIVA